MADKPHHRFTMLLPLRLWEWVRVRAAVDGLSAGAWIRRVLEDERRRR